MLSRIRLADPRAVADLRALVGRAARIDRGALRLQARGGTLVVWVPVLIGQGLLDTTPTVLGMRAAALAPDEAEVSADAVVALSSAESMLAAAAEAADGVLEVPADGAVAAWAGIVAPRRGWSADGEYAAAAVLAVNDRGVAEVAQAVPQALGASLVQSVRSQVWGRAADELGGAPAGVAFGLDALGFLGADPVRRYTAGLWQRWSTPRGHVLARVRSGGGV